MSEKTTKTCLSEQKWHWYYQIRPSNPTNPTNSDKWPWIWAFTEMTLYFRYIAVFYLFVVTEPQGMQHESWTWVSCEPMSPSTLNRSFLIGSYPWHIAQNGSTFARYPCQTPCWPHLSDFASLRRLMMFLCVMWKARGPKNIRSYWPSIPATECSRK